MGAAPRLCLSLPWLWNMHEEEKWWGGGGRACRDEGKTMLCLLTIYSGPQPSGPGRRAKTSREGKMELTWEGNKNRESKVGRGKEGKAGWRIHQTDCVLLPKTLHLVALSAGLVWGNMIWTPGRGNPQHVYNGGITLRVCVCVWGRLIKQCWLQSGEWAVDVLLPCSQKR